MRAFVCVRGPQGEEVELGHGDLVGRLRSAALHIDDPRISEAHAMLSLRGDRMKLLALRGRLYEGDQAKSEIDLQDGLVVGLGHGLTLTIVDVCLPDRVLAIEAPGLARQPLQSVMSLFLRPRPRVVAGFQPDADATIWGEAGSWRLDRKHGAPEVLEAGAEFRVQGELTVRIVEIERAQSAALQTIGAAEPLRIVVSYDTAEVHAGGRVALLSGVPARLLSELVAFDGPASWETLAGEVWGQGVDRIQLRSRFDMAMLRLRKRLREAAVRDELVVTTGTGQVQLLLRTGDVVDARM